MSLHLQNPERDIGPTEVSPWLARCFSGAALVLLAATTALEWRTIGARALAEFRIPIQPSPDDRVLNWMLQPNRELLAALQSFENRVENDGWLTPRLVPASQRFKLRTLHLGNESVVAGRAGWLHYRPDVDYVRGPGFLDPGRLARRARMPGMGRAPQPDPVPCMVDFAAQLKARGIHLILLPTPVKPELTADTLVGTASARVSNASFSAWLEQIQAAGIEVVDPAPLIGDGYLRADTHWTPEAMDRVASGLALRVSARLTSSAPTVYQRVAREVDGHGDLATMLKMEIPDERVTIQEVVTDTAGWQADPQAEVLLLGDSFSNIYAQEGLGWGSRAGLAEQLSYHLQRPVDRVVRNDAGSHATREMLARELGRGRDRLAGKKVVVWQFANRELTQGDWPIIPLVLRPAPPSTFLQPEAGSTLDISGLVAEISSLPVPGRVPYADHIAALHLVDLRGPGAVSVAGAYVFMWSMTNHVRTGVGLMRAGDEVRLRLRRWDEVAETLESYNRSELARDELMLAEPVWGEQLP